MHRPPNFRTRRNGSRALPRCLRLKEKETSSTFNSKA